ncbi:lipoate--protein ligase family protein [Aeoliella mucimassa]|uniref:Putative lipoate-protein ligase A n=1 Tax=Aeoliella mucimassa TaxID=2527972 RepID=A0A518AIF4_9BACT|nr:lipoate--protein ligase family protein [Aeoliella mucimassa]QDU54507.1 putative lipoate-protein ligase A [Aeoliella mucimassa]
MHLLNLTLDQPAANLALDEALLHLCEQGESAGVLRFWETAEPMVVVGRASRIVEEVHQQECQHRLVPVLRRISGGLSIVTGPGCLMYTVVEPVAPHQTDIDGLHQRVLDKMVHAIRGLGLPIERAGTSDLTIVGGDGHRRKVSGNSLRLGRGAYLYHGTLLYDFDLPLIPTLLKQPPRAPEYRDGRSHDDFIANLPTTADQLRQAIAQEWDASEQFSSWPRDKMEALLATKYKLDEWNRSR